LTAAGSLNAEDLRDEERVDFLAGGMGTSYGKE
jgi:hypothetical protein